MKVLFQSYFDIGRMYGGGPTVIHMLSKSLEKLGVQVAFHDYWRHKPEDFDIIHYFSCIGQENWIRHREKDPPLVVTPISWFDFSWKKKCLETFKYIARALLNRQTSRKQLGYPFEFPNYFFPNSKGEAERLMNAYGIPHSKIHIIPHGVAESFAIGDRSLFVQKFGIQDFVLCVGRFEFPRKNQLTLIRSLKSTNLSVVFIGGPEKGFEGYYDLCRQEATPQMVFLPPLPYGDPLLISAYHATRAVIMPALLESPGLSGLEGAIAGANVAATVGGSTREYFENDAFYFAPYDQKEMREKTLMAYENPRNDSLKQRIFNNFTWDTIAKKQLAAYQSIFREWNGSHQKYSN